MEYHNKAYNEVKKINPDVVIFEGQIDANIDKYIKHFGREKLFIHLHYQEIEKNYLDEYVNGFIAISKFIYDDYIKFLGDRAFRMNSYLIMNSVDEERFSKLLVKEEKLELRKKLGFEENDFVIIYCGRICEEKGVDKLIEAVIDTPPNIKLLIVGGNVLSNRKTVYWKRINNLISVNQNKIKSIGYIKNSEVYKYYQLADLHVVPSVWEEAAGLVVIEGQMAGVPQILTKSGGMVEYASSKTVILEKDNSLVENLAKNIVALSNNPGKLQAIKQAGLVNSKKYTKERYYNRFIDFLKNIEVKNEL